jgi:aminopeptidase
MGSAKRCFANLAHLVVTQGAALRVGQPLYIKTDLIGAPLAREIARQAYHCGASQVEVEYADNDLIRLNLKGAAPESLAAFPDWKVDRHHHYNSAGAARVTIFAPDPLLLENIDPARIISQRRAELVGLKEAMDEQKALRLQWTMLAVPTPAWARLVFPHLDETAGVAALWETIYHCSYIDDQDDTGARWQAHTADLLSRCEHLNRLEIRRLHFTNSLGTDLEMELCDGARFLAAVFTDGQGRNYCPNIPTEEVASAPHRMKVNGVVKSARPLSYAGALIDNFSFTFRNGLVVDYSAEVGSEALGGILESDEGARRLGEVAFVPYNSPISQTGLLFYNTLFDENAACHLALGAGYPDVIAGSTLTAAERLARGLNESTIHIDFMFGTQDMQCTATDNRGKSIQIFENGDFTF